MCKYCEKNETSKEKNFDITIVNSCLVVGNECSCGYDRARFNINYCPMCRKEAGRMKTEQEIKKEIQKHKEAIQNKIGEKTQDDKIHLWIIQTLEWVIK